MRLIYMQVGLAYLCLLISSCYGITAGLRARNQGLSNPKRTRLHIPMQLFPIAAPASSYKLYMHLRKVDDATPATPDQHPVTHTQLGRAHNHLPTCIELTGLEVTRRGYKHILRAIDSLDS